MSETPPMTAKRRQMSYALANHFGGDQQTGELRFTPAQRRRLKHKSGHARRARAGVKRAAPGPQQAPQTAQQPAAPDETRPQPMTAAAIQAAAAAPRSARTRGFPQIPFPRRQQKRG